MAAGKLKFSVDGKTVLVVHGTIEDEYWGKFDCSKDLSAYSDFDIVLIGHSSSTCFL
jgi:predicted phosphodiesterase